MHRTRTSESSIASSPRPHYGERWARPWLDLARYADSNGYEKDALRTMWKYRDWVIEALNRDMPFDQFTVEQLAGDMLPNATPAQRIATGFHRNTLLNQEGGIDVEEARWETLVDRVNTTAAVWLGSTIALRAVPQPQVRPVLAARLLPAARLLRQRRIHGPSASRAAITGLRSRSSICRRPNRPRSGRRCRRSSIASKRSSRRPAQKSTPRRVSGSIRCVAADSGWTPLDPQALRSSHGTVLSRLPDASILASGPAPATESYRVRAATALSRITGIRLEVLPDPTLPQGGPGRDYYGNFVLTGLTVTAAPAAGGREDTRSPSPEARADDSFGSSDLRDLLMKPAEEKGDLPVGMGG